jgi:hypothetical protein
MAWFQPSPLVPGIPIHRRKGTWCPFVVPIPRVALLRGRCQPRCEYFHEERFPLKPDRRCSVRHVRRGLEGCCFHHQNHCFRYVSKPFVDLEKEMLAAVR